MTGLDLLGADTLCGISGKDWLRVANMRDHLIRQGLAGASEADMARELDKQGIKPGTVTSDGTKLYPRIIEMMRTDAAALSRSAPQQTPPHRIAYPASAVALKSCGADGNLESWVFIVLCAVIIALVVWLLHSVRLSQREEVSG